MSKKHPAQLGNRSCLMSLMSSDFGAQLLDHLFILTIYLFAAAPAESRRTPADASALRQANPVGF